MDITLPFYSVLAFATLVTAIVVNTLFGVVVYARTYRQYYGSYFALTILGIVVWALGDLLLLFSNDKQVVDFGAQLFYIGPMIIPVFIWFFALSFPGNYKISRPPWIIAAGVFLVYSFLFFFNLDFFIQGIQTSGELNAPIPRLPGFILYAAYFSFFFMLAYITFYRRILTLKGLSRTQLYYTFYGALIASIPALITNLSLPIMGQRGIIWLGPFFTLFFASAVTLAIVKHRLFDIRPVIVRTLGYALTITAIASIYGFVIFGLIFLVTDIRIPLTVQMILAVSTGAATVLFQDLKQIIDRYTKKLFYRDAYNPQAFFDEYNKALVSTIDLDQLLKRTSAIIVEHLKADFCHIAVKDGQKGEYHAVGTDKKNFSSHNMQQFERLASRFRNPVIVTDDLGAEYGDFKGVLTENDVAVLVRLSVKFGKVKQGIGYIILGSKKSGNQYNREDAQVIEAVANELFIALQNALRFEEIERFNETLQQRVEDATRKLRESNKKLKQLNDSKDDFIGMTSHQLRTPLTSIKGYISLVVDGDAGHINRRQRELLQQAFASSQKMVYLVSDLLNVSRLKTGKFVIERGPVNLAKLIADEMGFLQEEAASRGLKLTYEAPTDFPILPLDETKTRQVIMNFLDNAIYYTPSGGHIHAKLEELPQSIEFRVIDDGIGVPKDERHQLFTKFFRARNAQRARPDGTGLGLYMAQKVVTAQGGAIIFSSEEGEGSTFGFAFPKDLPAEPVALPVQTRD